MLIVSNPHFRITLADGWAEDTSCEDSDALHFLCFNKGQEIAIHGFGLQPCETEALCRFELERAARAHQVKLLSESGATCRALDCTTSGGQIHVGFVAEGVRRLYFYQLRTTLRPVGGAHTVLSFSFTDTSGSIKADDLLIEAEAILAELSFPL